jgi:hypothetical protein
MYKRHRHYHYGKVGLGPFTKRRLKGKITSPVTTTKHKEPRILEGPLKKRVQIKCKCGGNFTILETLTGYVFSCHQCGRQVFQRKKVKAKTWKPKFRARKLKPATSDLDWDHERAMKEFKMYKKVLW